MNIVPAGEWHDYRRDDSRMGSQPQPGRSQPLRERWSVRLGGSFQEIVPVEDVAGDLLMADGGGIQRVSTEGEFRWRTKPFGAHWIAGVFDLDADGRHEILTSNGREVIILSAENGEFLFRDVVGPPRAYGTYATMFNVHSFFGHGMQILVPVFSSKEVLMYDCSHGAQHTRILHRLWMDDGYHPSIAIGDVNNDGVDEIVIARIGGVYVFDPASGTMISQTIWKSDEERRRNYGHFELVDLDGDGNLEAVILSDKVSRHIAVLGNDGSGNFQPKWDRFIEHIYPNDTTELRYTSNSVRDLNGDGRMEIAVSMFNERNDGRWHTLVLDPESGEMTLDLADQYLHGVQDGDGDGFPELFLSKETSRQPKTYSELSICSPRRGEVLWNMHDAHFAERAIRTHRKSSEFKPDVFAAHEIWNGTFGNRSGIFIRSRERGLQLLDSALKLFPLPYAPPQQMNAAYRIAHIGEDSIYITESSGDIIRLTPAGSVKFLPSGYHLTTEAHIAARPGPTPTVASWCGTSYLAVPDFSGNVLVWKSNGENEPIPAAKIRGRSRLGYDNVFHAASIVSISDGPRIVVVDDENLSHSRLSLYSLNGERMRSFEFLNLPASQFGNRIGCYDWLYFVHSRGEALFASFYQSPSMNSECSLAFLLETGEILWRNDHTGDGEFGRGVGPWGTSSVIDHDGRSQAVLCAKDTLIVLDLETGEFVEPPKLLTEFSAEEMRREHRLKEQNLSTAVSADDPFTAYGTPIVHDEEIIVGGCLGAFGVLPLSFIHQSSALTRWWHIASFGDVLYRLPGIGDVDGDGRLELGQGHATGAFCIYDHETGTLRATLDLDAISTDVLTLDVNADGRMEFLIGTNDGRLITIGFQDGLFKILDQIDTGAAMGSPIAADLAGNGNSEVFVVTGDGYLRCFS